MQITFKLETLLLLGLLLFIIFSHTLCSCFQISFAEGSYLFEGFKSCVTEGLRLKNGTSPSKGTLMAREIEPPAPQALSKSTEGFSNYASSQSNAPSTKSWFTPDLEYTAGNKNSAVKALMDRKSVALPEGELSFFATTPFSNECCANGSSYSNSNGCACMTIPQYTLLKNRGGNNVPYSEF